VIDFAGHFHVHDEYSPLDGSGNRNQLSWAAVHAGQSHLGFTNHGRLGGALEHVHACRHPQGYDHPLEPDQKRHKDERLIPILGLEAFFRRDRFMELTPELVGRKNPHNWAHHLCVHAASLRGWRTLMRLSSKSWVRREEGGGYYGKPVIDFDMLEDDHEDIIISTACLASPVAWHIMNGDEAGAKKVIRKLEKVSKDGIVWMEIMPHDLDAQRDLNIGIVNLAYEMGQPLMATGDVHIPFEDWKITHQVVRMASYKSSFLHREAQKDAGEDVYTEEIDTVFLSSKDQMLQQFTDNHPYLDIDIVAEAMGNTSLFAKQVKWYVVGKSTKAPKVDVDARVEVERWATEGYKKLLNTYSDSHWDKWSQETYEERFNYEFKVLMDKGVMPYFYIVGDFVRWARSEHGLPALDSKGRIKRDRYGDVIYEGVKRPIRVGLGRGSAAGCLVSYLIGITAVDPIPHKLLFERFLNPDRVGYPDIDMDFETSLDIIEIEDGKWLDGRACIKEYVKRMYGHDHVADIIAYQTFSPKVNIKDVGQVFDLNWGYLNQITESIGDTDRGLERIATGNVDKGIVGNELLRELRDSHPDVWDVLLKLEDQILRDTRHAGGIVITPRPINHYIPTQIATDESTTVTAWADRAEFPIMADYGFLKYDLLGVKGLAKQEIAVQLIEDYYGEEFEPNDLSVLHDPDAVEADVIRLFERGVMWDIFQFGGRGIQQLLRHIHPENATDISVANALYRPGPIAIAFEYGDRKQGKVPITYWHDALEPILGETLGLMCFQEQAMEVVKVLAGFSGGDADKFRKIMSKLYRLPGDKAQEVMKQDRERFIHGCMTVSGLREQDAASIFDDRMLPLGNYLFNRSHSSSYGLQAIQDAHIKQHWPLAFYASALTLGKKQKKDEHLAWMRAGLREARIFDIDVKPPDINLSERSWTIDDDALMYGLASIEGLGGETVQSVIKIRNRKGKFRDLDDFIDKMPTNFGSNKVVALAQAGAFDRMEDREELLSRARAFADGVVKFKLIFSCKHLRTKTLKNVPAGEEEKAVKQAVSEMKCKHHPNADVAEVKVADETCEVARYRKDHPDKEPVIVGTPTFDEIERMEFEALNVSLSASNVYLTYKPFIEARVYTQEEVEELPSKPSKKGKKHGNWCTCDECEASLCIVGGELVNVKVIRTRAGDPMAFADMVWDDNRYNLTFFPQAYREYKNWLEESVPFFVSGCKQQRKDGPNIIVNEMSPVIDVAKDVGWDPKKVTPIGKGRKYRKARKLKIRRKAS
jgi:DNA polymerase III subunit alpha